MQRLHLNVVQGPQGTQAGHLANARRTEFIWNDTFTAFRMVPLKWWDDASYAVYQGDDTGQEGYYGEVPAPVRRVEAPVVSETWIEDALANDEIPF